MGLLPSQQPASEGGPVCLAVLAWCTLLSFSNQEAGFDVCLLPWELVVNV